MSKLALPKGKKPKQPLREPDMISKRGIPYFFAPEWVRVMLNGSVLRIAPIKVKGGVELNTVSKDGNVTYIQGSIQREFLDWHEDQKIDCILLGMDEDDLMQTNWEYE